jgi:hypothetical protein
VGANGREVGAAVLGCQRGTGVGQEASSLKDSRTTEYNVFLKKIIERIVLFQLVDLLVQ